MIESPLLQAFRNEFLQEAILHTVRTKFGGVPPEVESRIREVQDPARLMDLNAGVAVSPDLGTFQTHLASP
jgi:hypothetical protein